jgi:type II secretory pathway pseudopilin PulG
MQRYLKSFSLIEVIFTIFVIAIIASIAFPKLFSTSKESSYLQLKSDLATIQRALLNYKNNSIMKNTTGILEKLEEDDTTLFSNILSKPIPFKETYPHWSKKNDTTYLYNFSQNSSLEFFYDKNSLSFLCDTKNTLCQKVLE